MPPARAYYNELDPFAADWLDNLIRENLLPPGDVDRRSIRDVHVRDLRGYTQHHFFAGIGGWPYALRLAGWPDDRPVWTGSCPCQPFSCAGAGLGTADDRHLWPAWYYLLTRYQPAVVFGEQVAGKLGRAWLEAVRADVEELGYEFGGADLCAAGVGAPHIRQRLYWVADSQRHGRGEGRRGVEERAGSGEHGEGGGGMADTDSTGRGEQWGGGLLDGERSPQWHDADRRSTRDGRLADTNGRHTRPERQQRGGQQRQLSPNRGFDLWLEYTSSQRGGGYTRAVSRAQGEGEGERLKAGRESDKSIAASLNGDGVGYANGEREASVGGLPGRTIPERQRGSWAAADWLLCRDGYLRPVESGTFPLVAGLPGRVGRLRGYGNSIVPQVAEAFVRSYMEARGM